jgi:DNA-binding NtrC family response regulator
MKKILLVDDEKLIRWSLTKDLERLNYAVEAFPNGKEALAATENQRFDLALLDVRLPDGSGIELLEKIKTSDPDMQVIMITAFADVETAVNAIRLGAFDFILKPFTLEKMRLTIQNALNSARMRREIDTLKIAQNLFHKQSPILCRSQVMTEMLEKAHKIGQIGAGVVLLSGESGTGKGILARELFRISPRAERPFIEINCGAIPENLFESEIFGHERGAFTGAVDAKKGLLEMADGGTIFLDEITEMPVSSQKKFLKALEEQVIWRVGGCKAVRIDVNIIAATNRDLSQEIKSGRFREDLYYRLNIVPLHVPPLRERREDIDLLADRFLEGFQAKYRRSFSGFSDDARREMHRYQWPGNVRELKNSIERAVILEPGTEISVAGLGLPATTLLSQESSNPDCFSPAIPPDGFDLSDHLKTMERAFLEKALAECNGNQTAAARLLGMTRDNFRYRLKQYHLPS